MSGAPYEPPPMFFAALASELPASFPGAVVGAALGALAFVSTLFAVRRLRARRVVSVPPYPMLTREAMFAPVTTYRAGEALQIDELPDAAGEGAPDGERLPTRAFRRRGPSMLLSARSLAEMGIPVGPFGQRLPSLALVDDDDDGSIDVDVEGAPAVIVSPIIVLTNDKRAAGPHPLGVIKSSSLGLVVKGASVAGLDLDDSPTQISETFFDEIPSPPVRKAARPKIRPVAPAEARFPDVHP